MCIGVYTLDHPQYALILATNRDEYLARPTENAHFHAFGRTDTPPRVLSGRDLQAGGSWFGINSATGRVALLTNITEPPAKYPTSRGALVSSFLLSSPDSLSSAAPTPNSSSSLEEAVHAIVPTDARFAGFNLLLFAPSNDSHQTRPDLSSPRQLHYAGALATNHGGGGPVEVRALTASERACGAVSNGVDGAGGAAWPKVVCVREALEEVLRDEAALDLNDSPHANSGNAEGEHEGRLCARLFELLSYRPPALRITSRDALRHTVQVDPVPLALHATTPAAPPSTQTPTQTPTRTSTAPPPRPGAVPAAPFPAPTATATATAASAAASTVPVPVPVPVPAHAHAATTTAAPPQPGATPTPTLSATTGAAAAAAPGPTPAPAPTPAPPCATSAPKAPAPAPATTPTALALPFSSPSTSTPLSTPSPAPPPTPAPPAYYGTRLASVLLVRRDGRALFIERDIWVLDGDGDGVSDGHGGGGGSDGGRSNSTGKEVTKPVKAPPENERVFRFTLDGW